MNHTYIKFLFEFRMPFIGYLVVSILIQILYEMQLKESILSYTFNYKYP